MTKIFISYSSKNRDLVEQLANDLELFVYDAQIWFDRELLRTGGQRWWDNILAEIRKCEVFLYAISPQILTSEPCKREYAYAMALGKPILPVVIVETEYRHLPLEIQVAQIVTFIERARTQQVALRDSIRNLPKVSDLPDPLPISPDVPLDPVGVLFDRIANLTTDAQLQRYLLADIEALADEKPYRQFVPELLQKFLERDDVVVGRNIRVAKESLKKSSWGIETPSKPVTTSERELEGETTSKSVLLDEALKRARDFHKTGRRNGDWKPFITTFPELKIPDMPFCLVPTGSFQMGNDEKAKYWDSEKNDWIHGVSDGGLQTFLEPFYLAQYPITNSQWAKAVELGVVKIPLNPNGAALKWYQDPQMSNSPVVGISWFEAQTFAEWLGCRLPAEHEWEYAARGIENLTFPWGNNFDYENVVCMENSDGKPWNVRSKPQSRSWVDARHLVGNVWEWSASLFINYPYEANTNRENSTGDNINVRRVLRGGSWYQTSSFMHSASRNDYFPNGSFNTFGFRILKPL